MSAARERLAEALAEAHNEIAYDFGVPEATRSWRDFLRTTDAIYAADPGLQEATEFGLAWQAAVEALPEGEPWMLEVIRFGIKNGDVNPHTGVAVGDAFAEPYQAVAGRHWDAELEISATGPTPTAALHALARALRERGK